MNKKLNKDKSYIMFIEIIDFHSIHRPPYSYEIFSNEDKTIIVEFAKKTFYHNFSMIENIFKYNMNIVLNSTEHVNVPSQNLPKTQNLSEELLIEDINNISILKSYFTKSDKRENTYKKHEDRKLEHRKSDIEIYEEMEMDKLKTFVNSFYRPKNDGGNEKSLIDNLNIAKAQVDYELKEAKNVLNEKTGEIMKETHDRLLLANNNVNEKIENMIAQALAPPKK